MLRESKEVQIDDNDDIIHAISQTDLLPKIRVIKQKGNSQQTNPFYFQNNKLNGLGMQGMKLKIKK